MASISADSFGVKNGDENSMILDDHSRKRRTRNWFVYPTGSINSMSELQAYKNMRTKEPDRQLGRQTKLPKKMAFALWLAHREWLTTQR